MAGSEITSTGFVKLPAEIRPFADSLTKCLMLYMGSDEIEMLVGTNVKAKIKFEGGPITKEVIEDTLAHLAFYKKYFPKSGEDTGRLDTPEKIVNALALVYEDHRREVAP